MRNYSTINVYSEERTDFGVYVQFVDLERAWWGARLAGIDPTIRTAVSAFMWWWLLHDVPLSIQTLSIQSIVISFEFIFWKVDGSDSLVSEVI